MRGRAEAKSFRHYLTTTVSLAGATDIALYQMNITLVKLIIMAYCGLMKLEGFSPHIPVF